MNKVSYQISDVERQTIEWIATLNLFNSRYSTHTTKQGYCNRQNQEKNQQQQKYNWIEIYVNDYDDDDQLPILIINTHSSNEMRAAEWSVQNDAVGHDLIGRYHWIDSKKKKTKQTNV